MQVNHADGKREAVLITGAAKRIGKALALMFAAKGYDIALHYHNSGDAIHEVAEEVRLLGAEAVIIQADLVDPSSWKTVIDKAFSAFAHCTILINNASLFEKHTFPTMEYDDFHRHMQVNAHAPIFLMQAFAQKIEGKGCIINMVDSYITKNHTPFASYLLSKKLLWEATKMAACNFAPHICVNAVAPGIVDLPQNLDDDFIEYKKKMLPMQQTVSMQSIEQAVWSIVTQPALIGQCIYVDSGEQLL